MVHFWILMKLYGGIAWAEPALIDAQRVELEIQAMVRVSEFDRAPDLNSPLYFELADLHAKLEGLAPFRTRCLLESPALKYLGWTYHPREIEGYRAFKRSILGRDPAIIHELTRCLGRKIEWPAPFSGASARVVQPGAGSEGNLKGNESAWPKGTWALTFDDGPSPLVTPKILSMLQGFSSSATFFQVVEESLKHPALTASVLTHGHDLGNHSMTHADFRKATDQELLVEIDDAQSKLTEVSSLRPLFFRNPYGADTANGSRSRVREANLGLIHVFWTVDSLDWSDKDPLSIFRRVKTEVDKLGKGIVLFHDIHPQTEEASRLTLEYLRSGQARLIKLSEIVPLL